jgi:ABC-type branched-subunit amino acid transport system substrate-binding protein
MGKHTTMKRRHLALAAATSATVLLSACGSSSNTTGGGGAASASSTGGGPPVAIGLLAPMTGAYAGVGTGYQQGLQVAFDQANSSGGVLGGRQLTISVVDESISDTTVSTGAMRKFASDGDKIVVGAALSQNCIASAPVAEQLGMLNISPGCGVGQLIGPNRLSKTFFSSAGNDAMLTYGLEKVLTQKFPSTKSLWTVNYDYVTGHEVSGALRKAFSSTLGAGGGEDKFVPLGASDYSSVISSLASKATGDPTTQGLILTNYGSGALAFLKQAGQAGLLKNFSFIATTYMYYAAAKAFNGTSPKVWDAYVYVHPDVFQTKANTDFVTAYKGVANGALPNDWGYSGYITGLAIVQALKKTNSLDVAALNTALEGMTVNGPSGSFTVDKTTHHFLMPAVVAQIGGDSSAPEGVKLYDTQVIPGPEANSHPIGG